MYKRLNGFVIFFLLISLAFSALQSCKSRSGGRTGSRGDGNNDGVVRGIKYTAPGSMNQPDNLVYVPTGSFVVNPQNGTSGRTNGIEQSITVNGFWIDAYEVTNSQYHQFVNWVRDSIAAFELNYYKVSKDGDTTIDWGKARKINYQDEKIQERLSRLFLPEEERFMNRVELDPKALVYRMSGYDFEAAVRNPGMNRNNFFYTYDIPVYPDTLVWVKDFAYSSNENMVKNYFSHPAYMHYPVVGVSQRMAMAYAHWRTRYMNEFLTKKKLVGAEYRLPTEAEWQLAAAGGHKSYLYPWGNYLKNDKDCMMANFKNGRGDYAEDGALYPARVDSYFPNDYGIYNIVGNVAEWTVSNYIDDPNAFQHDFNPEINLKPTPSSARQHKRKVTRGGSWKDPASMIQLNSRAYDYMDSARSYIGFRCVIDLPPGVKIN